MSLVRPIWFPITSKLIVDINTGVSQFVKSGRGYRTRAALVGENREVCYANEAGQRSLRKLYRPPLLPQAGAEVRLDCKSGVGHGVGEIICSIVTSALRTREATCPARPYLLSGQRSLDRLNAAIRVFANLPRSETQDSPAMDRQQILARAVAREISFVFTMVLPPVDF